MVLYIINLSFKIIRYIFFLLIIKKIFKNIKKYVNYIIIIIINGCSKKALNILEDRCHLSLAFLQLFLQN